MAKTVKEILREAFGIKYQGDSAGELLIKLCIDITEAYENEIAEKDKDISWLKDWIENGNCHWYLQKDIDKLQEENQELKNQLAEKDELLSKFINSDYVNELWEEIIEKNKLIKELKSRQ